MNREEFEKWYQEQYAGYGYNEALATFERQQKIIDELREENPDVPCPVCGGKGGHAEQKRYPDDNSGVVDFFGKPVMMWIPCNYCKHTGTVPLTKAQEYRIRELEAEKALLVE